MENCQSSDVVLIFVPMLCIRTVTKFTWVRKWEGRDWGSFWCKYWSSSDTGTLFRSSSFVNSSKEKYFASLAWDANRWQWDSLSPWYSFLRKFIFPPGKLYTCNYSTVPVPYQKVDWEWDCMQYSIGCQCVVSPPSPSPQPRVWGWTLCLFVLILTWCSLLASAFYTVGDGCYGRLRGQDKDNSLCWCTLC